jgi:hypothetical protein
MILQNILYQKSEKVWNIGSQSRHRSLKYFRHQTPDQIAEREKSDAALQVLALCNVRAKLKIQNTAGIFASTEKTSSAKLP